MNVVTGSSQSDPGQCWIQGRCFLMSYHDGGCVVRPLSLHLLSLNQCRLWGKAQLEMWTVCYKVKHGSLWSQLCQQDHTSGYCVQPLWRRLVSHSGRHNPSSKPKTVPSKGERSRLTLWCVCVCVCVCVRQEREEEEGSGSHLLMLQSCGPSWKPWRSCVAEPSPWWFTGGEWEQERHWIETWNISGALLGPVVYLSKGTDDKLACLFDKFKHFLDINYFY